MSVPPDLPREEERSTVKALHVAPAVDVPARRVWGTRRNLISRVRSRPAAAVLFAIALALGWEIAGRGKPVFSSYPSAIASSAVRILVPDVLPAFQSTLIGLFAGLGIAIPIAIVVGIAMGRNRAIEVVLSPYVNALFVTPRIALVPLLVLWFGLDFELRLSIVILSSVFPMIVNVVAGMKQVDPALLDVGRVFVASPRQRLLTIIVPGALPYIFTGLRIGLLSALGGVLVAEMTSSITGIGARLINYGRYFETDKLFVVVFAVGLLGLSLSGGLERLQRRVAPWTSRGRVP